MLKQTKIVATISDRRCEVDFLQALYNAGMNVVRINSAHMDEDGFDKVIRNTRQVSGRIGILMDTKGPEIRTTTAAHPIDFRTGEQVKVKGNPEEETTHECISVSYPNFVEDMKTGDEMLIDDGDLSLRVTGKHPGYLVCEVMNDATLGSRKSVNVPGVRISLPSLTGKDRRNILYSIKHKVDFIAHSFVRNRQDVLDIRRILDEHRSPAKIIAKIENQEGVDNIDEILEVAYGIMIARGDLGIEVPAEKIPGIQRVLIRKCVEMKKPVIVATQMLHSMISNPRPTRAEVTDIANAIYYRTDALMLSGETAYGKYPLEAVQTMTKVIYESEKTKLTANDIRVPFAGNDLDVTSFLAKQAVKSSSKLHVKAIITDSHTGRTARYLAAFRGTSAVYAICYREEVMRMLSLSYGVRAVYQPKNDSRRSYLCNALNELIQSGHINRNSMVAYLSGSFGEGDGGTSFLEINSAGKMLDAASTCDLPNFHE
jgi:pyruvate kinase